MLDKKKYLFNSFEDDNRELDVYFTYILKTGICRICPK
jgi:hypothetical protein